MIVAPLPVNELARRQGLRRLKLLDSPPEPRFDQITALCQQIFAVPVALFTLVDADRQWFKSNQGLPICETSRDISFCSHVVASGELMVINDARKDERFTDNPLVNDSQTPVIFYAGVPLVINGGEIIGTLCLIDHQPRHFDDRQLATLRSLAATVEYLVKAGAAADDLEQEHALFADGPVGVLHFVNVDDIGCDGWQVHFMSKNLTALLDQELSQLTSVEDFLALMLPSDQRHYRHALIQHERNGQQALTIDFRLINAQGELRWFQQVSRADYDRHGAILGVRAYVTEFTQRKQLELQLRMRNDELRDRNEQLVRVLKRLRQQRTDRAG